jgi:hypothetical protein
MLIHALNKRANLQSLYVRRYIVTYQKQQTLPLSAFRMLLQFKGALLWDGDKSINRKSGNRKNTTIVQIYDLPKS